MPPLEFGFFKNQKNFINKVILSIERPLETDMDSYEDRLSIDTIFIISKILISQSRDLLSKIMWPTEIDHRSLYILQFNFLFNPSEM